MCSNEKRRRIRRVVPWLAATLLALPIAPVGVHAQTTSPASQPAAADAIALGRQVIRQLGDPSFRVRRAAQMRLNSLPGGSYPAVREALDHPERLDLETHDRLAAAIQILPRRAALEAKWRARDEYLRSTLLSTYRPTGTPAADDAARAAIEAFTQLIPRLADPNCIGLRQAIRAAFHRAVLAGCTDPLLTALDGAAAGQAWDAGDRSFGPRYTEAYNAVVAGERYSPIVKLIAAVGYDSSRPMVGPATSSITAAMIAAAVNAPNVPPGVVERLAWVEYAVLRRNDRPGSPWNGSGARSFAGGYRKAKPGTAEPYVIEAAAWIDEALDVHWRTGEFNADMVKAAEAACLKAYAIDPTHPGPPTQMVLLMLARPPGQATDDEVETWYARAMEANPDNLDACRNKLTYLSPQWRGDSDRMLDFGRECLQTQNWRGGLPRVLVEAHQRLADQTDDRAAYFRRPEVWRDCAEAYEGAVVNFPDDRRVRSEYAKLASTCEQWAVADAQFKVLADRPDLSVFVSKATYDYLRAKAARLAAAGAEPAAP